MSRLNLYSVFHCNLAYSSIHEEDHRIVLDNCYWPLLDIHEKYGVPFGIEFTGSTLGRIDELDGLWISRLQKMCSKGMCDVLASGYSQIIGPLVPRRVNEKNLEAGLRVYEEILGIRPKIAYINEQAYSSGLADVYIDMGFDAIFMEWNNVYSANNGHWKREWQYYPQAAVSAGGRKIPVIWNDAVSFQRLQRYIHGEISDQEYIRYIESHLGHEGRSLCMYGNDAEIFNFRPGRYDTETDLDPGAEWKRYEELLGKIGSQGRYSFVLPTSLLNQQNENAFHDLTLGTAASPIPVKKQSKYNITRWALTGRDDVRNNGTCYRLYSIMEKISSPGNHSEDTMEEYWKELCCLWGSDYRTHITDSKYTEFIKRQGILEHRLTSNGNLRRSAPDHPVRAGKCLSPSAITRDGQYVMVETSKTKIILNSRRGMAIDGLIFKEAGTRPLMGTLHQGYFSDMSWGVDLYSGHVIIQPVNQSKITDLEKVDIREGNGKRNGSGADHDSAESEILSCTVNRPAGSIHKTIHVSHSDPKVEIEYIFQWNGLRDASFRAGIVTVNPEAFDEGSLYYSTHNGGPEERYYLKESEFNHSQAVGQSVISAAHCLGATEGLVRIGDKEKSLIIRSDKYQISAQPMVEFHKVDDKYLLRLYHSLGEHDETSHWMWKGRAKWKITIELGA